MAALASAGPPKLLQLSDGQFADSSLLLCRPSGLRLRNARQGRGGQ
jgi:hypothetical protein